MMTVFKIVLILIAVVVVGVVALILFALHKESNYYKYTEAVDVFVKRKCEQKGPKKVSTFSTRFHVVSNVFPKYQMLTF